MLTPFQVLGLIPALLNSFLQSSGNTCFDIEQLVCAPPGVWEKTATESALRIKAQGALLHL